MTGIRVWCVLSARGCKWVSSIVSLLLGLVLRSVWVITVVIEVVLRLVGLGVTSQFCRLTRP